MMADKEIISHDLLPALRRLKLEKPNILAVCKVKLSLCFSQDITCLVYVGGKALRWEKKLIKTNEFRDYLDQQAAERDCSISLYSTFVRCIFTLNHTQTEEGNYCEQRKLVLFFEPIYKDAAVKLSHCLNQEKICICSQLQYVTWFQRPLQTAQCKHVGCG